MLAFLCVAILPYCAFVAVLRKWPRVAVVFAGVYLLTYVYLSAMGSRRVASRGGSEWVSEWCPRYLVQEYSAPSGRIKTEISWLGAAYLPCILLDQMMWHRTAKADI